ncbi:MAG: cobyrinic acid a,c-diamide synthase, partial [Chloroflexi bacterium]|nr:cobyrinic acid a,c-diamide synthase [Chloroflexota bacterium]
GRDPDDHCLFPRSPIPKQATVAVAMDRAFNFYYPDSLDLLAAWGADIVPFSPLESPSLPSGADGVYVGGGFPELHAGTLAANVGIRRSLRHAATRGMPMYGECGGLMYFGQSLVDEEGREHPMTSLVPARSTMIGARLTLGYRTARLLRDTPVARAGEVVRGHEFHFSVVEQPASRDAAVYEFVEQSGRLDGFVAGTVTASYLHLHFAASTGIARRFVETCAAYRRSCR